MPTGRFDTKREGVHDAISAKRNELLSLFSIYVAQGKGILQSHQLIDEFLKTVKVDGTTEDLKNRTFMKVLQAAEEAIVLPPFVALAIHPRPGVRKYVRVNVHELSVDHLTVSEYLRFKEELVKGDANGNYLLEPLEQPGGATRQPPLQVASPSSPPPVQPNYEPNPPCYVCGATGFHFMWCQTLCGQYQSPPSTCLIRGYTGHLATSCPIEPFNPSHAPTTSSPAPCPHPTRPPGTSVNGYLHEPFCSECGAFSSCWRRFSSCWRY